MSFIENPLGIILIQREITQADLSKNSSAFYPPATA